MFSSVLPLYILHINIYYIIILLLYIILLYILHLLYIFYIVFECSMMDIVIVTTLCTAVPYLCAKATNVAKKIDAGEEVLGNILQILTMRRGVSKVTTFPAKLVFHFLRLFDE